MSATEAEARRAAARRALERGVREQPDVAYDPRRLRAWLSDECPGCEAEIAVLTAAAEVGVPGVLAGSRPHAPVARLSAELRTRRGIDADHAEWSVRAWARALGAEPTGSGAAAASGAPPAAAAAAPAHVAPPAHVAAPAKPAPPTAKRSAPTPRRGLTGTARARAPRQGSPTDTGLVSGIVLVALALVVFGPLAMALGAMVVAGPGPVITPALWAAGGWALFGVLAARGPFGF